MISIIIPTLNEEGGISYVLKHIPKKIGNEKVETIIVDGGSTDSTLTKAKSVNPDVRIVIEKRKGKGLAMQRGVKHARGNKIVFIDGDGEYNPKYIPYMVTLLSKCDMVKGYRIIKIKKMDFESKLSTLLSKFTIPIFKDFESKDPITGLRALRKKDWERLKIKSKNFVVEAEIEVKSIKHGFKIIEFPIIQKKRMGGKSKYLRSHKDFLEIYKYIRKNKSIIRKKTKNIITIRKHRY